MIDENLARVQQLFPEHGESLRRLQLIRTEAMSLPYDDFFEPKSVLDLSGKTPRLIAVTRPDVLAWTRHMAYSTRVRMLALEPAIVASVAAGSLTSAMVLLRSHAETAGLACLSLLTLRDGTREALVDLIQRTLFGSALARGWKPFEDLAALFPMSEFHPPTAGSLMDALDRFVAAGVKGNGRYKAAYGLMCEYAHPNSRGMLGFARSTEEALGWQIHYSATEQVGSEGANMALSLLVEMMRLGYSGSEFLRNGDVHEAVAGFSIAPPQPNAMRRILTKLMLLEGPPS